LELRRIWTSTELADYLTFPHAAQVFCVQRHTTEIVPNKERSETVYGITSLTPERANPQTIMQLLRGHWSIENRLHWVRDVSFDEDRCRIRKGKGPQNMACLRNLTISLLRMAGVRYIPTGLRACSRLGQGVLRIIGLPYKL
jgi:hypothetical protein